MVLNDSRFRDPVHRFCYRCVFPKPPPAESILTCGEGGILGPVVGVMGVLMAMEVMKIILFHKDHVSITAADLRASTGGEMSYDDDGRVTEPPSLLLYSAYGSPLFRSVRLRGQRKDCISCSDKGTITRETLASGSLDYDEFCGVSHPADILSPSERVTATTYNNIRETFGKTQVLIDVREKVQFDICHLKGSINLPYSDLSSNPISSIARLEGIINTDKNCAEPHSLYFICRFGNDSQLAVSKLQKLAHTYNYIGDVKGGLRAWRQQVDADFPDY